MKSCLTNDILNGLCKEYNIELPNNLKNMKIYKEIANFKNAEYIYCIAYEMLIRTDEYNELLKEYESLKNISKEDKTNEEFAKLRELIERMNALGLKKTSFLGFDCGYDNDHVFKKIEYYNEIINSPWSVREVYKFQLDESLGFDSIYHMLIDFYNNKNELYVIKDKKYQKISLSSLKKDQALSINDIHTSELYKILDMMFIPCGTNSDTGYRAIGDIKYIKDLDEDFLKLLKEKKNSDLLITTKGDFGQHNAGFWMKYYVNDIKNGLGSLIDYYSQKNLIYNQDSKQVKPTKNELLQNPSNYYILCVDTSIAQNGHLVHQLEYNGIKSILYGVRYGSIRAENIYLVQIDKHIPLNSPP